MIPVARNVWQQVEGGRSAAAARRLIIARTRRRESARPVSRRPRGVDALEERRRRRVEPGPREVVVERLGRPMVGRDVVTRAALLVEPEPPPALLPEVVRPPHRADRAHPRDAVEPHRDERPVAPAGERTRVDRREEPARLGRREHRRRARRHHVLGLPHGRRRVHRQDLADDEPVAEHAEGRQVLRDGGRRPGVRPDVGRHVQRRDRREPQAPRRAAHHARNCPTARPYAARVRRFAIRAAKNSRNLATATGPASTISGGNTSRAVDERARLASGGSTRTTSSLMPSPRPRRARRLPVDERLELLVIVRQRLGEREEPPDGVLRAAEAHLDPAGLDRHALGEARESRLERLNRHRDPDPGEPRLAELGHQARAPLLLAAERGPLPVLPQLPQERGPPKDTRRPDELRPERPHQLRRPRPRHPEQPLHVAPREQVQVQGLELADGVGDGDEPPGRGGIRQASSDVTCLASAGWEDF